MDTARRTGWLDRLEDLCKALAAGCLMAMALVTGADIVCRAAFNAPILGSEEIVTFLAVLALGFSLPYAHSQGSNIGVEILVRRFRRRTRNAIKRGADLMGAVLFGLVAWRMVLYGMSIRRTGEVSMTLELPKHYVIYALALGFAVFSLQLARDAAASFGKEGR